MQFLKSLPGWALVFAVTCRLVGAASLDGQCLAELCAETQIQNDVTRAVGPTPASFARKRMTNAERLSRGLTPNPPARSQHAARQQPSVTPKVTYLGNIQVRKSEGGQALGWLSAMSVDDGVMSWTSDSAQALRVSFTLDAGDTSGSGLRLTMLNGESSLLGFIVGRAVPNSDLSTSTWNFLYLNGIDLPGSSAPYAPPENLDSIYGVSNRLTTYGETDLWSVNVATGQLTPQWINRDGSAPDTVLFSQRGYIYAGGSISQFNTRYPDIVTPLYLEFELESG